jgi:parvulin-like peptidyl-prolyl isomerase
MVAGKLHGSDVAGEVTALKHQFADEAQFRAALRRSGIFQWQLGRLVEETIAGERWIEKQIAQQLAVSDAEMLQYFQQHEAEFTQPLRIRARHIFLAAPEGSAPEITEAKDHQMLDIAARLGQGEDFTGLAAAMSEDEASKKNGGDLGFFAADRVPLEFFDAAAELQPNGPPRFLHSHLGFHALQSTDIHPARLLTLTEATPEIRARVSAEKRRSGVAALKSELARSTHFVVQ